MACFLLEAHHPGKETSLRAIQKGQFQPQTQGSPGRRQGKAPFPGKEVSDHGVLTDMACPL